MIEKMMVEGMNHCLLTSLNVLNTNKEATVDVTQRWDKQIQDDYAENNLSRLMPQPSTCQSIKSNKVKQA